MPAHPQPQLRSRPACPRDDSGARSCRDRAGPVPTAPGPAPGHEGARAPCQLSREPGLAKMAALCESFTLRGPGPGDGGSGLSLEPGPGRDFVLLTERGRAATLFKVRPARPRGAAAPPWAAPAWGRVLARAGAALPPGLALSRPGRAGPRCPRLPSQAGNGPGPGAAAAWPGHALPPALPAAPAPSAREHGAARALVRVFLLLLMFSVYSPSLKTLS